MSRISTVEDSLIEHIKEVMQNRVRTVEWAPPDWDEDFFKRILIALPGVFLIFGGGQNPEQGAASVKLKTIWTIVAATRHVQEAKQRARGDAHEIGCYDILETVIPALDGHVVEDVGTLQFVVWDNDAAMKLEKQALMVQSARFEMLIEIPRVIPDDALVPFERFHGTYDIGQPEGAPVTEDIVELEQEP
jgi:Mu-like prophage protein gp37